MGSQAEASDLQGPSSLGGDAPLVGHLGQEFVQMALSTSDPVTAVRDIQRQAALKEPRCAPLLELLDQLGVARADAHRNVLRAATDELLARVPEMEPEMLLQLLEVRGSFSCSSCAVLLSLSASKHIKHPLSDGVLETPFSILSFHSPLQLSFPFIGISELRAVPLAVLDRLHPVPAAFVKQLAVDRELFWALPPGVQRQVWEADRKLLQAHALPLLTAYSHETATVIRALNMDGSLPEELVKGN
jgi:negative elongation factor B